MSPARSKAGSPGRQQSPGRGSPGKSKVDLAYSTALFSKAQELIEQYVASIPKRCGDTVLFDSHGVEYITDAELDSGNKGGLEAGRQQHRSNLDMIMRLIGKKGFFSHSVFDNDDGDDDVGAGPGKKVLLAQIEVLEKQVEAEQKRTELAVKEAEDVRSELRQTQRMLEAQSPRAKTEVSSDRVLAMLESELMYQHDHIAKAEVAAQEGLKQSLSPTRRIPGVSDKLDKVAAMEQEMDAIISKSKYCLTDPEIQHAASHGLSYSNWLLARQKELNEHTGWLMKQLEFLNKQLPPGTGPSGELSIVCLSVENVPSLFARSPTAMMKAIQSVVAKVNQLCAEHCGYQILSKGSEFQLVFRTAEQALSFSATLQQGLLEIRWPEEVLKAPECPMVLVDNGVDKVVLWAGLRMRCAVHCGRLTEHQTPEHRSRYVGPDLDLCMRILDIAHGGEIVVSDAIRKQVDQPGGMVDSGISLQYKEVSDQLLSFLEIPAWFAISGELLLRHKDYHSIPDPELSITQVITAELTSVESQLRLLERSEIISNDARLGVMTLRNLLERNAMMSKQMRALSVKMHAQVKEKDKELKEAHAIVARLDRDMVHLKAMEAIRKGEMSIEAYMDNVTKAAEKREAQLRNEVELKEREKQQLRSQLQQASAREQALLTVSAPMQTASFRFLNECVEQFTNLVEALCENGQSMDAFTQHLELREVDFGKFEEELTEATIDNLRYSRSVEEQACTRFLKCWSILMSSQLNSANHPPCEERAQSVGSGFESIESSDLESLASWRSDEAADCSAGMTGTIQHLQTVTSRLEGALDKRMPNKTEFVRKYVDGLRHPMDRLPVQLNAFEARTNKKVQELEELRRYSKLIEEQAEAAQERAEAAEAAAAETAARAEAATAEAAEAKAREKEAQAKSESFSAQMREAQVMAEEARAQAQEATTRAVQAEARAEEATAQAEEAAAQSADFEAERRQLLTSMDEMQTSMADIHSKALAQVEARAAAAEAEAEAAAAAAAEAIASIPPESPKFEAQVQTDPIPEPAPVVVHVPVPKSPEEAVDVSRLPTPDDPRIPLRAELEDLQDTLSQLERLRREAAAQTPPDRTALADIKRQIEEVKRNIKSVQQKLADLGEDPRIGLRHNLKRLQEIFSQLDEVYQSSPEEGILSQMVEVKQKTAKTTHQLASLEPEPKIRLQLQLDELEVTHSQLGLSHRLVHERDLRKQTESPEKQIIKEEMKQVELGIASVKQQLVNMEKSVLSGSQQYAVHLLSGQTTPEPYQSVHEMKFSQDQRGRKYTGVDGQYENLEDVEAGRSKGKKSKLSSRASSCSPPTLSSLEQFGTADAALMSPVRARNSVVRYERSTYESLLRSKVKPPAVANISQVRGVDFMGLPDVSRNDRCLGQPKGKPHNRTPSPVPVVDYFATAPRTSVVSEDGFYSKPAGTTSNQRSRTLPPIR